MTSRRASRKRFRSWPNSFSAENGAHLSEVFVARSRSLVGRQLTVLGAAVRAPQSLRELRQRDFPSDEPSQCLLGLTRFGGRSQVCDLISGLIFLLLVHDLNVSGFHREAVCRECGRSASRSPGATGIAGLSDVDGCYTNPPATRRSPYELPVRPKAISI